MDSNDGNNRQNEEEESPISFSLQLQLIAAFLGLIADAINIWSVLEAIDEEGKIIEDEGTETSSDVDVQLEEMQAQIDQLTREVARLRRNRFW